MRGGDIHSSVHTVCKEAAEANRVFHWPLEFPAVMAHGGFDAVIGNPPWERIKLQEQEFFAARDAEIATAPNKAERDKLIKALKMADPGTPQARLSAEFEFSKRASEAASIFVRKTGRFPLTGMGDVNTYALFAEHFARLARTIAESRTRQEHRSSHHRYGRCAPAAARTCGCHRAHGDRDGQLHLCFLRRSDRAEPVE